MRKFLSVSVLALLLTTNSFSQIDDILKKIPGLGDVFEEAVTTSIKDAYPRALWLNELDKQINLQSDVQFNTNLDPGFYRFRFNTFCLHAGAYSPTEGAGYLVAPLKGAKAELIKNILSRYGDHPEIDQKDVQMLVWGIEANQKFSNYPHDFQFRVTPLLKPEEIAMMEVDVKEIGYDLLPDDVKQVLNLYSDLRNKLSSATSTYEDIEKIAVKTGIAPIGKGSKNIDAGTWTSIGDGVYMRCFPEGYKKSNVEIYIPSEVTLNKDSNGNIVSINDGNFKIDFNYESGASIFKTAKVTNISTNEEVILQNSLNDESVLQKDSENFMDLIKQSFGKKKSSRLEDESIKSLSRLRTLEKSFTSVVGTSELSKGGYSLIVNAVNNYVSKLETGNKKGGEIHSTGLGNVNGLVFAPANTSNQRLGNGGPEGGNGNGNPKNPPPPKKNKDCNVNVSISQLNETDWPEPDHVFTVTVNIDIQGTDEECNAEEVDFTLFDVSKERGRCLNDKEQMDDVDEDLQMSDLNADMEITKLTAKKMLSGKSQSVEVYILCRDWGAFGKLKASVKVKGNWYEGEGDATPDKFVTIPLDLNDNKIADGWEKQMGVYGQSATSDNDPNPSGQARDGDGMTNYEEYRGFYVSDGAGGKEHVRMDPKQKEIFVIDDDQLFDIASWKAASGIKAYWLTSDMVYGSKGGGERDQNWRWVNFCRGYAPGLKYAIHLKKVSGIPDPYNLCGTGTDYIGCSDMGPVKNANLTIVLPDRISKWLIDTKDTLAAWLARFPKAKSLVIGGQTYSTKEMKTFVDAINNPAKFGEIMNFYINLTAIHEVGHALGVPHHGGGDPKKTSQGSHKCPMRYLEYMDPILINSAWFRTILDLIGKGGNVIVTYTKWKFCKTGDNCWKKIDTNDN